MSRDEGVQRSTLVVVEGLYENFVEGPYFSILFDRCRATRYNRVEGDEDILGSACFISLYTFSHAFFYNKNYKILRPKKFSLHV